MSMHRETTGRRKRMLLTAILAGFSLTACASFEALAYASDCLKVTTGELEIDCEGGTWRMNGVCVSVRHAVCQSLGSVTIEVGTDVDGDGKIGPGEPSTRINDPAPGTQFCVGSISGDLGPGGKNLVISIEAYQQGGTQPALSKNEVIPLD